METRALKNGRAGKKERESTYRFAGVCRGGMQDTLVNVPLTSHEERCRCTCAIPSQHEIEQEVVLTINRSHMHTITQRIERASSKNESYVETLSAGTHSQQYRSTGHTADYPTAQSGAVPFAGA